MTMLNNILLRPNLLETAGSNPDAKIAELLLDTMSRILRDLGKDRVLIAKIIEAGQEGLTEFLQEVQTNLGAIMTELKAWLAPFMEAFQSIATAGNSGGTAERLLAIIQHLIPQLSAAADAFTVDNIMDKLKALAKLVERALGVESGAFSAQIRNIVEHIADHLMVDYLAGDNSPLAIDAYQVGNNLRQLRILMLDFVARFDIRLDLEAAVNQLGVVMRQRGWDEKVQGLKTTIENTGGSATALSQLIGTFSVSLNTPGPGPLPPQDPVSWYATWFLPEWKDGKWFAIPVGVADRFAVTGEPWFPQMAFKKHTYETMEWVAEITSAVGDYLEAIAHFVSTFFPPKASNIMHMVLQLLRGTTTLALGESTDQGWVDAYKVLGAAWFEHLVSGFSTLFFTSFPGSNMTFNGPNFLYFFTSFLQDFGEEMLYANYSFLARELIMSSLTLDNTDKTLAASTRNHEKIAGLTLAFADIGSWLGAAVTGRRYYGFGWPVAPFLILGLVPPMALALLGPGIAQAHIDKPFSDMSEDVRNSMILHTLMISLPKWFLYWNIIWEGNTDGGKYGDFLGYPPKESSPYLMPYKKDLEKRCVQANMGIWSHHVPFDKDHLLDYNHRFNQVYSFDFTHDFRDEVLAMRDGYVKDFWDYIGDNSSQLDNRVDILHDCNKEEALHNPDPVHDRRQNGIVTSTWGQYLHGSHFGVRHAFAALGVPESSIKGTPVRQGQVVMYAGNTGISGHNHLHVNVKVVGTSTIPFVFRDAPDKGTLRSYRYFKTENVRKQPIFPKIPIRHPHQHASIAKILILNGGPYPQGWFGGDHAHVLSDALEFNWVADPFNEYQRSLVGFLLRAEWGTNVEYHRITSYRVNDAGTHWALGLEEPWVGPRPLPTARFEVLTGIMESGRDFVVLDPFASTVTDAYKDCHILITWKLRGRTYNDYQKITSYEGGARKAFIYGDWRIQPPKGAQYEIGSKPYAETLHFEKQFSFWSAYNYPVSHPEVYAAANVGEIGPGKERDHYIWTGSYNEAETNGTVASTPTSLQNILLLPNTDTAAENAYNNRFIVILTPTNEIVAYKLITGYTGSTAPARQVTIEGTWDVDILNTYTYKIGKRDFDHASDEEQQALTFYGKFETITAGQPVIDLEGNPVFNLDGSPQLATGREPRRIGTTGLPTPLPLDDDPLLGYPILSRRYQTYKGKDATGNDRW